MPVSDDEDDPLNLNMPSMSSSADEDMDRVHSTNKVRGEAHKTRRTE